MPTIKNQETVDLIAHNYCKNGHNKTRALIDAEYKPGYADSGTSHKVVFGNVRVKEAIAKIEAESHAKIEYNYELAIKSLNQVITNLEKQAKTGNISANQALTQAIREKNAITGLHSQTIKHKGEPVLELNDVEEQALAAMARDYKLKLAQGLN